MKEIDYIQSLIRKKFAETGSPVSIPLIKPRKGKDSFTATLHKDGIEVDNLGKQYTFLKWAAFEEAIKLMIRHGGEAIKGYATSKNKLGDSGLTIDSIEGHVASVVYGKKLGTSVFRRITPIACILIWVGICESGRGKLMLK